MTGDEGIGGGMARAGWLLREGDVLTAAEMADRFAERARGLLGRTSYDGAFLLPRCRSVHTAFMRFPLDVAYLDDEYTVVGVHRMAPWRVTACARRGRHTLEAAAGSFERWGLRTGDRLEFREVG